MLLTGKIIAKCLLLLFHFINWLHYMYILTTIRRKLLISNNFNPLIAFIPMEGFRHGGWE